MHVSVTYDMDECASFFKVCLTHNGMYIHTLTYHILGSIYLDIEQFHHRIQLQADIVLALYQPREIPKGQKCTIIPPSIRENVWVHTGMQ